MWGSKMNPTSIHRDAGSLLGFSGLGILRCCELWCRLAYAAPIQPLSWERPYAMGAALKSKNKQTNKLKALEIVFGLKNRSVWA